MASWGHMYSHTPQRVQSLVIMKREGGSSGVVRALGFPRLANVIPSAP